MSKFFAAYIAQYNNFTQFEGINKNTERKLSEAAKILIIPKHQQNGDLKKTET